MVFYNQSKKSAELSGNECRNRKSMAWGYCLSYELNFFYILYDINFFEARRRQCPNFIHPIWHQTALLISSPIGYFNSNSSRLSSYMIRNLTMT